MPRSQEVATAINAVMTAEMERRAKAHGFESLYEYYKEGDYASDVRDVVLNSPVEGYDFDLLGSTESLALYRVTVLDTGEKILLNCWCGDGGQPSDKIEDGGMGFDDQDELHEEEDYYPNPG